MFKPALQLGTCFGEVYRSYGENQRRLIGGFFVTVTSLPVTAYFRLSTGDDSTTLVIGVPYGSSASISASRSLMFVVVTFSSKSSPPVR